MSDVVVSLNGNKLRVTYKGDEGMGGIVSDVSSDVAQGSNIIDKNAFITTLRELIDGVVPSKSKNLTLNFLVEPQDVFLEFITVNKRDGDPNEQVISNVKKKLPNVNLDEMFFSYQKIAPFVYQFVGIRKDRLEDYLDISNEIRIGLGTIVPWVLMLPKLINDNKPEIFISKDDEKQVVALSDLGGIFFAGVYDKGKNQEELGELVGKLSVYNRNKPINKIYTVNYESFSLGSNYDVLPLERDHMELEDTNGYESHLLFYEVIGKRPEITETQINLLNLLPLPVNLEKKKPLMVIAPVAAVVVLTLVLAGYFLFIRNSGVSPQGEMAQSADEDSVVLSDNNSVGETTQSEGNVGEGEGSGEEVVAGDLKKEDLKIRVENGSGVAGDAGRTRDYLAQFGYDVVGIGDAAENRTTTLVRMNEKGKLYKDLLTDDLQENYKLEFSEDLEAGLDYDVLIIVGTNE